MQAELLALQTEPQLVLESERLAELARHLSAEDLVAAAPGLLGRVHRDVGAPDQLLAARAAVGRVDHDADARAERERALGDDRGLGEALEQPLGERGRVGLAPALDEHGELVAAEARHGVARARGRAEAARHLQQHLVADVVPEAVVDLLEPVEVDEQQRDRCARALPARQRLLEPVAEERAVGEAGEAVVERLPRELLLERDPLADVAPVEHHAAHVLFLAQVGDVGLDVAPLAEVVAHAEDDLARLAAGARGRNGSAIVVVHGRGEAVVEQLVLLAARHARDRLARVATAAVVEDEHEIGGGLHEAAEARRLTPRRGGQDERQQQRGHETGDAEQHLGRDQFRDAAIGTRGDRARGVERDVRRQGRQHLEAAYRIGRGDLLPRRQRHVLERRSRQPGAPRRREVVHEAARLDELTPLETARRRQVGLVVVAVHGRRLAAADERVGALPEQASRSWPDRPCRRCARASPRARSARPACAAGPRSRRRWRGDASATSRGSRARR